jgi:TonB family protein
MSGPDPSKTPLFFHGALREPPSDAKFETDLADLATKFAAQGGGGLSPELSAGLALEIVLNEIVEQACLATGATGAAIVLERDGEMVCRATSGSTAPELGSRLDTSSGLSGECFKTQHTQWCDDARSDQRVDLNASERLGVRSIVVMPLLRGTKLVGVIELFSSQPYAFGVRDERTLEVLADRTLNNLDHAARPLELQRPPKSAAAPETSQQNPPAKVPGSEVRTGPRQAEERQPEKPRTKKNYSETERLEQDGSNFGSPRLSYESPAFENDRGEKKDFRFGTSSGDWLLGAAALACAILLGLAVGRHWGARSAAFYHPHANKAADGAPRSASNAKDADTGTNPDGKADSDHIPPGGLLVLNNGKEVFRMPPKESKPAAADRAVGISRAASLEPDGVMELPAATAESNLVQRVEPDYPEAAREQKIQGPVVLEVHIAADGTVQDIEVISGPPVLAQAASDAVKQWKFKPQLVKGSPVEMQTRVTLKFRLPK